MILQLCAILFSGNIEVTWGTLDTSIMPRHAIRTWVKIVNRDSIERFILPNRSLIPEWEIFADNDTVKIGSSGYIGTFDKDIELRPSNGLFIYDLLDLTNIDQAFVTHHSQAKLAIRMGKEFNTLQKAKALRTIETDNISIENYFNYWSHLKASIPKGEPQLICNKMQKAWDSLSRTKKIYGELVQGAISIRALSCNEGFSPSPYPLTPSWKAFEDANICIESYRAQGQSQSAAYKTCSGKIHDLNHFTRTLVGASSVIKLKNGVKLVTPLDTLRVYPIDYWEIP